ncbi:hypothetical protein SSP531S_21260 [Streptomyces spongiicola]|uniref:Formate-dependent nitrite reductase complex subunit NrfF n=2 Tax=Streptomyces spongiicola TaxID=1690221 RepID=A0A388SVP0_9ACTN|nr:hypothetical protein [Streptomyces spongiicola]GBQ00708.1 hypothetical protein SSP531S_21260 [Streptomyces spongiicola]
MQPMDSEYSMGQGGSLARTVVRCAEGHVFTTSSFPMQQLGAGRIGPGRLIRCPRCARLRHAVPVALQKS